MRNTGLVYYDISSIKEGDEVCIEVDAAYGWVRLRRPQYLKKTVARITPAKRKVVMTDGTEYNAQQLFVYPNEETEQSTRLSNMLIDSFRKIFRLNGSETQNLIDNLPDEKLEQFCKLINEAYDIYNTRERNINK